MRGFAHDAFAASHPWVARLVLAASCLALIAESGPDDTDRRVFALDLPPMKTELSPEVTTRWRVHLRATKEDSPDRSDQRPWIVTVEEL